MAHRFETGDVDVRRAAVVGREDDERVGRCAALLQRREDATHDGVRLHHEIRVEIEAALVFPFRVHRKGRVGRGEREVEEKGFGPRGGIGDEGGGAVAQRGQTGFELPVLEGGTGHAGLIFYEAAGGEKLGGDAERAVIFDETKRRPVGNVGAEVGVEAARGRPARDRLGEYFAPRGQMCGAGGNGSDARRGLVVFARWAGNLEELALFGRDGPIPAEMPLTNHRRAVAVLFCKGADRHPIRRDQRLAKHADNPALQFRAPVIAPGEQRVAGRRAHPGRRMSVGEAHALRREPVDVRRGNFPALRVVALDIAVTEVVGEDDEDVGLGGVRCGGGGGGGGGGCGGGEGEKEGKSEGEKGAEERRGETVHGLAGALVFRRSMGTSLAWRGPGVLRPSAT